jgi:ATP-dependent RNA helicase RhlE
MDLNPQILKTVAAEGYEVPTPIQAQAIPHLLTGRDLLGIAQTGTGKTAAFALPTLDYLFAEPKPRAPRAPRVLVLAPTRELAGQITDSFRTYSTGMSCLVQTITGGVKINQQIRALARGLDILVATPGRLVDLMGQGAVRLDAIEVLILDEADQMLDMGFIHDIRKIMAKVPSDRQTILFSATMPDAIASLADQYLDDPVKVSIAPQATTAERVTQGVLHVATENKPRLLESLLREGGIDRTLVFTRTKHGADKVVKKLAAAGFEAAAIHGNKSQPQRNKALAAFRDGRAPILVATDIAARGIDIDGISHVINYEMPNVPDQYVHRIGRTARAGRDGIAISLVAEDELFYLREVEKITRQEIGTLAAPEGCDAVVLPTPARDVKVRKPKGPAGRGGRQQAAPKAGAGAGGGAGRPASPRNSRNGPRRRNRSAKPAGAAAQARGGAR